VVGRISAKRPRLLVGTRKGAFILDTRDEGKSWKLEGPIHLGHIVHHMVADPENGDVILMASKTGHLGPTLFWTTDGGKVWTEATKPPAFPKVENDEKAPSVDANFWLSRGHAGEKNTWYAGSNPPGLFRSEDNGSTWEPVDGFNNNADYAAWMAAGGATPGGHLLHSIIVDPRDANHMYLSISVGGTFESTDKGKSWMPLNKGVSADWLPEENIEYGHDPHCVVQHPANPDRLYQQNHCGIYKIDRPGKEWSRIGNNMPKEVGDIGFPMVVHPRDAERVWVFPMDGTTVWPRTSPDGKPAVYTTADGGTTWKRQDKGMPTEHGYWTVKRQAMAADNSQKVGLYIGTSSGEVWASTDEGASWSCIARHLPEIYSLTIAENK
jgi:photosystem II stability/assembly factor-like uncharacterized protein